MVTGAQCVTTAGTLGMPLWCAGNLGLMTKVYDRYSSSKDWSPSAVQIRRRLTISPNHFSVAYCTYIGGGWGCGGCAAPLAFILPPRFYIAPLPL